MEKYYTPDITDFHIGMTIEINEQCTNKMIRKVEWHPVVITLNENETGEKIAFNRLQRLINSNKIRVKYLDKQDIDSLINYDINIIEFIEDNVYEFNFNKAGIEYKGFYTYSDRMISFYEESNYIFWGIIKNKSELNKLMIQLGF